MRRRQVEPPAGDVTVAMPAHLREWVPEEWTERDPDPSVCGQMSDSHRRWRLARASWAKAAGVDPRLVYVGVRDWVRAVSEASMARGGRVFHDEMRQW